MNPVITDKFGFELRWYSVILLVAFLVGYLIVNKEAKRFDLPKGFMFNMIFWIIIFGIIGARIYYVIFDWSYFSEHIDEIIKIWYNCWIAYCNSIY